jgi:hypothetical protein
MKISSVNHIITPPPTEPTPQPPQQPNFSADTFGSSIPIIPPPPALPFFVDVHEDPLTSSPTTPDFHDAIDALQ